MSACVSVASPSQSAVLPSHYLHTLQVLTTESREVTASVLRLLRTGSSLCTPQDLLEVLISEEEIRRKSREALCAQLVTAGRAQIDSIFELEIRLEHLKKQLTAQQTLKSRKTDQGSVQHYDLSVCINSLKAILDNGWRVHTTHQANTVLQSKTRALVAVVGMHNAGKTHLLSKLMSAKLPSGSLAGLGFKCVDMDTSTALVLVDTAGLYKPLRLPEAGSDQEAMELLVSDIVLSLSDYFLCVVGNWTSIEQRFLQKVAISLASVPNRVFREVIVIHNLKEVTDAETLQSVWTRQIADIAGTPQHTEVAAVNPCSGKVESRGVMWAKSEQCRHVCLVNDYCELGDRVNPWALALIKVWLKGIVVAVDRDKSVLERFILATEQKLSLFYRQSVTVTLRESSSTEAILLGQIQPLSQLQTTDLLLASSFHDQSILSFSPAFDILKSDRHFQVCIDLPGVSLCDVKLSRLSTVTVVRGRKADLGKGTCLQRERARGEFVLSFSVPQEYEKRWSDVRMSKGVLTLSYLKDTSSNL